MPRIKKVRTRKRGKSYSYIFEAGKKPDGKRNVVEKGGFSTEEKAYNAGIEALNAYLHGDIASSSDRILFTDYMVQWLEKVHKSTVASHVYIMHVQYYKKRIEPFFTGVMLQDIRPANIDTWQRYLLNEGLSKNTIKNYRSLVHNALNYAIYPAELISSNPAMQVQIPSNAPTEIVKRKVLDTNSYQKIINDVELRDVIKIVVAIAYHTGMRVGEILGLTWDNVDFDTNRIQVCTQIIVSKGKRFFTTKLKKPSSYRDIYIDDGLVAILKDWREKQIEYFNNSGDARIMLYVESIPGLLQLQSKKYFQEAANTKVLDFVCVSPTNGKLLHYAVLAVILRKLNINSHSLRYTHATMLAEAEAPLKSIANRLGHKNISLSQDLYTKASDKLKKAARDKFQAKLQTSIYAENSADKT